MSPKVFTAFEEILNKQYSGKPPEAVVEVGAYHWSLLGLDVFKSSRKIALNLSFDERDKQALAGYEIVTGNTNQLPFADASIDCIMSCSVLEHDKYFWKSIEEIKRVLKPGGMFVVGVPVYLRLKTDRFHTTLTYHLHGISYHADFYRFSLQTIEELMLDGYEQKDIRLVRRYPNPYAVAFGIKP